MSRSRRLLTAVVVAASISGIPAVAGPADGASGPTVEVHGRLLVVPSEVPGGTPSYGVAVAGGDIVPVSGRFDPDVRTGAVFDGRLAIPTGVVSSLARRGDSDATAALKLVDRRSLTLTVVGTPSVTQPEAAQLVTPTVHPQFVAAMDDKGALQTDVQLLAHVTAVGSYWESESNGAIAGITVPATVTHYSPALTTSDCGLGNDFFDVVQEAASKFPALDLSQDSPDQLVLFVPDACASSGIVGEGTLGDTFASGGALVVKAGDSIEGTYAHETGHNYGFNHANARYGSTSLEYYGVYDVMGFALDGFNQLTAISTPFRVYQGITDPGEVQNADPGTGPTPVHITATIKPRSDDVGLRSVRVQDPDTGEHLYLDYRAGTGQDAGAFYADTLHGYYLSSSRGDLHYAAGVTFNATRGGSGVDTLVLDAQGHTSLASGASWSNASGDLTVTVTSLSASGATIAVDYSPVITPAPVPTISGTPRVGRPLSVTTGSWMTGVSFAYQWYVGGVAAPGATGTSYTPAASDLGTKVRVEVTGSKTGLPSAKRTSVATAAVAPGLLVSSTPTISGRARVGRTLTARHGTWSPGTTFSYAWFASGKKIAHRSGSTLRLTKAQRGKRITVRVTGKKPGYTTLSKTSARTSKVR